MVPAVKSPPAGMVPAFRVELQVTQAGTALPNASRPTALNCCVAPGSSIAEVGVSSSCESGPAETVTVANAVTPFDSARTVLAKVPVVVPALNTPAGEMVPPPETTLHVGV